VQKLVVYSPPETPTPNHNPVVESIELFRDGSSYQTFHPGDAAPCVPVGVEIGLWPHLGGGAGGAETYTTTDLSGNAVTLTETPRYSFYATDPGDIDGETADEPVPGNVPPRGISRLTALAAGPGVEWVVVRDGRGGENWIEMPFEGKPSCP
jgi:hypothetical protein